MIVGVALMTLFVALAFHLSDDESTQLLKKLGVPEEDARDYVWLDFSHAIFSYPRTDQILAIAKGDRPAVVKGLVEFAKAYTQSEDFRKRYETFRQAKKPEPPDPQKSMYQLRQEQKEQLKRNLDEVESGAKNAPPEMKEQYDKLIDNLRASVKSVDDPNNPMFSPELEKALQQEYDVQLANHRNDSLEWARRWPAEPKPMLARGLKKFLDVSSNVDYNAALVRDKSGFMFFANPDYERKPPEWKVCYRAGKATVEAARTAAGKWLTELESAR